MAEGKYFRSEIIEQKHPELFKEWQVWLDTHLDPGNYDTYKERDQAILPYINGKPQWVTDVYMPPHLVEKLEKLNA